MKKIISLILAMLMVASVSAASAVGTLAEDSAPRFNDVSENNWFYDDVTFVYGRGLMKGTSDTDFTPNGTLSRAMSVTLLYRLAGEPVVNGFSHSFADVADGKWYSDAVLWAHGTGIAKGRSDVEFAPNDEVTRAEFAVFLTRYAYHAELELPIKRTGSLADSMLTPKYAKMSEQLLYQAEIVNGLPGNRFGYYLPITRAEAAAMVHRFTENTVPLIPEQYIDVAFIGNSITGSGRTDEHFAALGKDRGVRAYEYTEGGALLPLHYQWFSEYYMSPYTNTIEEAEYVVFQEFAGAYPTVGEDKEMYELWGCESFRGVNAVGGMMDLFGRDKEYFSYCMYGPMKYPDDRSYDPAVLAKVKELFAEKYDLTHVYVSDIARFEPSLGLNEREHLIPDGIHPNDLMGYLIALILYCEIFDVDPTEQNNGDLSYDDIPGETQAEKDALLDALKVVVKEILALQK